MINYKLSKDNAFAQKYVNSIPTGEWANIETNQAYLKWVDEGNTPEPADNNG